MYFLIYKLEKRSETESENLKKKSNSNTLFKIPIFQPTAAAAMMYMNSSDQQRIKDLDQDSTHEMTFPKRNEALPFVCMRCRKESVFCSTSVQTEDYNLINEDNLIHQNSSFLKNAREEKKELPNDFSINSEIISSIESATKKQIEKSNDLSRNKIMII